MYTRAICTYLVAVVQSVGQGLAVVQNEAQCVSVVPKA